MTGLSMVRMISHVGVRLMVRHGGGGHRPTDGRIKAASLRPGRLAADGRKISDFARCALLHDSVRFGKSCSISDDRTSRFGSTMTRDDDLRIRLGRVRDRGRARRAKPFIAQALAAAEKAGGFKRRSGRAARGSTFGRGRAASFAAARYMADRGRAVSMVKARVVRHGIKRAPLSAHLEYLAPRGRNEGRGCRADVRCRARGCRPSWRSRIAARRIAIISVSSCRRRMPSSSPT